MCVLNAETGKATSVRVTVADATSSRNISQEARSTAQVKLMRAKGLVRTHWCQCGSFNNGSNDGLCAKCRQPYINEYKERGNQ